MENATSNEVSFWGCMMSAHFATEPWQVGVFLTLGGLLLILNLYQKFIK